ncbi:MAG: hypothetical protein BGO55_24085 [Sphingobacteriales bacterium 50-39]|nr:MAG: hypothetical protein BGO55_24085 [Sphingobacteriales bacterium 50-39]
MGVTTAELLTNKAQDCTKYERIELEAGKGERDLKWTELILTYHTIALITLYGAVIGVIMPNLISFRARSLNPLLLKWERYFVEFWKTRENK